MKDAVTITVGVLTAITLMCGLIGLATRYVLVPWMKEHVIGPVKETNHQVTVNKHISDPPTLLDKIDHVQHDVTQARTDIATASTMFEGHIDLSAEDRRRLWEAIEELRKDIRS